MPIVLITLMASAVFFIMDRIICLFVSLSKIRLARNDSTTCPLVVPVTTLLPGHPHHSTIFSLQGTEVVTQYATELLVLLVRQPNLLL
jgi:hypothetical protein